MLGFFSLPVIANCELQLVFADCDRLRTANRVLALGFDCESRSGIAYCDLALYCRIRVVCCMPRMTFSSKINNWLFAFKPSMFATLARFARRGRGFAPLSHDSLVLVVNLHHSRTIRSSRS